MTNKFESKCLQKFYVSSKHEKECYMKTTSLIGGFHAISGDTNNNGEMNKGWWTNKAS